AAAGGPPPRADPEAAARLVEDRIEDAPRPIRLDASFEARLAREPLEDREVRIGIRIVAVDAGVRRSREHLVVAGVGKILAVGVVREAALRLVSEELAVLRDDAPEERQERA